VPSPADKHRNQAAHVVYLFEVPDAVGDLFHPAQVGHDRGVFDIACKLLGDLVE
jgi:hypothetical protein